MRARFVIPLLMAAWVLFSFSSCGDMIKSLRSESRAVDDEVERDREGAGEAAAGYRARPLRGLSANNVAEHEPSDPRAYKLRLADRASRMADDAGDPAGGYHRVTRDDFVDKAARENSLWDSQGQTNYLFANNRRREPGDILTADVEKDLRREIQYQLWLTLPPEQRRAPKRAQAPTATDSVTGTAAAAAKAAADQSPEAKAKDAAEEAAKTNITSTGKEDDIIRMEVVENMGSGMMRVLGQKRVVYKGVSRTLEVAALVHSKDVDDGNHTKSSSFLDMKAQVIQ